MIAHARSYFTPRKNDSAIAAQASMSSIDLGNESSTRIPEASSWTHFRLDRRSPAYWRVNSLVDEFVIGGFGTAEKTLWGKTPSNSLPSRRSRRGASDLARQMCSRTDPVPDESRPRGNQQEVPDGDDQQPGKAEVGDERIAGWVFDSRHRQRAQVTQARRRAGARTSPGDAAG